MGKPKDSSGNLIADAYGGKVAKLAAEQVLPTESEYLAALHHPDFNRRLAALVTDLADSPGNPGRTPRRPRFTISLSSSRNIRQMMDSATTGMHRCVITDDALLALNHMPHPKSFAGSEDYVLHEISVQELTGGSRSVTTSELKRIALERGYVLGPPDLALAIAARGGGWFNDRSSMFLTESVRVLGAQLNLGYSGTSVYAYKVDRKKWSLKERLFICSLAKK